MPAINLARLCRAARLRTLSRAVGDGADRDDCGDGLPYPFICRLALRQRTSAEALAVVNNARRMAGMSYTVGDRAGQSRRSSSANTFVPLGRRPTGPRSPDSRRAGTAPRIKQVLQASAPGITPADLQRLQRDHGPGNLCAHTPQLATLLRLSWPTCRRAIYGSYYGAVARGSMCGIVFRIPDCRL